MRNRLLLPVLALLVASSGCSDDTKPPTSTADAMADVNADITVDGGNDASPSDTPATDTQPTDAPITDTPVTDAPVTDVPITDTPVTDAPITDAPITDAPITDTPVTDAPITDVPVADAPTDVPVIDAPSMDASLDVPVTDTTPIIDTPSIDTTPIVDVPATDTTPMSDLPLVGDAVPDTASDAPFRCLSSADCVGRPEGPTCEIVTGMCRMGCTPAGGCSSTQTCCGTTCADTQNDPNNCGACGNVCVALNGVAGCRMGVCTIDRCNAPYGNCDGLPTNGCEIDLQTSATNCGMCGNSCATTGGACSAGVCGVACSTGRGDCDRMASNGCETDVTSDVSNCGACGRACASTHASARCLASTCFVDRCETGYGDCDGMTSTGCETDLQTSATNCGACGRTCDATMGFACSRGTCVPEVGLVAWYRLDGNGDDSVSGGTAATNTGATAAADRFGTTGAAMLFAPAAMSRLQVTNARLPVGRSARTLSLWMRTMTRFMAEAGAMANWGTTADHQRFGLTVLPDVLYFVGENDDLGGLRPVSDGRWHHVAVTYDGTTVVTYLDGINESMAPKALNTVGTQLLIGRAINDHYPGRPVPEYFEGTLDDVRVYNRALDSMSVNALYQEGGYRPM